MRTTISWISLNESEKKSCDVCGQLCQFCDSSVGNTNVTTEIQMLFLSVQSTVVFDTRIYNMETVAHEDAVSGSSSK